MYQTVFLTALVFSAASAIWWLRHVWSRFQSTVSAVEADRGHDSTLAKWATHALLTWLPGGLALWVALSASYLGRPSLQAESVTWFVLGVLGLVALLAPPANALVMIVLANRQRV